MKTICLILTGLLTGISSFAQFNPFENRYRITPWSGNKKAAACITFDDNCPGQFDYALPELNQRNLKASFFIITGGSQCGNVEWSKVDSAFQKGHEIGSHSVTHVNMQNSDSLTIENELSGSYNVLRQRYYPEGHKITIAYPFGRGGGSSAQDRRIRRLAQKYYYGGRSAGVGPSGYTGYNDYTNSFYNAFYMQLGTYVMGPGNLPTAAQLSTILDNSIQAGGLFTGLYHGIETGGFNNMPITVFREHLDSMVARQSRLWVTTFGKAVQYHTERRAEPKITPMRVYPDPNNAWGQYHVVKLEDTLSGAWFKEPLTIRLGKTDFALFVDTVLSLHGARNIVDEGDTVQFDLSPGDSAVVHGFIGDAVAGLIPTNGFALFPNPAHADVTVEIRDPNLRNRPLLIEFTDLQGRKFTIPTNAKPGEDTYCFRPPSFLKPGIYQVRVISGNSFQTFPLEWNPGK